MTIRDASYGSLHGNGCGCATCDMPPFHEIWHGSQDGQDYNLQVKAPSGAIFPIAQNVRDKYRDWDAADMQAATLSKLDTINIRVWGGKVQPIRKSQEAWTVVLVHVKTWNVWGEYKDGYSL